MRRSTPCGRVGRLSVLRSVLREDCLSCRTNFTYRKSCSYRSQKAGPVDSRFPTLTAMKLRLGWGTHSCAECGQGKNKSRAFAQDDDFSCRTLRGGGDFWVRFPRVSLRSPWAIFLASLRDAAYAGSRFPTLTAMKLRLGWGTHVRAECGRGRPKAGLRSG
jgi:hypothetical protein